MAGGSGSRFWPLSNNKKPKQFLKIIENVSLITATYNRLLKVSPKKYIFVVSSKKYISEIKENIVGINKNNIILEPSPKNTAPAIYLVANKIFKLDSNAILAIYPSDHFINDKIKFSKSIKLAHDYIKKNKDAIVTLGVKPKFASTSYGYMKLNNKNKSNVFKVEKFIEKPNLANAKKLIKNKNVVWNAGIFVFKAENIIKQIKFYIPEFEKYSDNLTKNWKFLKSDSFDYAILEKAKNCYSIKVDFTWSDIGTWQSLFTLLPKDKNNNVIKGNYAGYNSKNNLIISPDKLTAIVGLDNIAVINVSDATLIIDLSKSDELRYLVNQIKNN